MHSPALVDLVGRVPVTPPEQQQPCHPRAADRTTGPGQRASGVTPGAERMRALSNRPGGIGTQPPATTPQPRVEQVAHRVSEHVEAVHHDGEEDAGPHGQPRRHLHVAAPLTAQQAAPAGNAQGQPEAEKAQAGLGDDDGPMVMLKMMMMGANTFGSTWRSIVRHPGLPTALAAWK